MVANYLTVGAGAVVTRDAEEGAVAIGVPTKKLISKVSEK